MSSTHQQPAQGRESAAERRRKRKERESAKGQVLDPKNVVSGAGQPLDPGVRRELEEQLGHDLSRVRLHTDRQAGQLTDLLGADAVAVGPEIFFREGAFRPGTQEGHRLLAHEVLHTVQNPSGLGSMLAGRDQGAVSLPQQAIEREAESAAQSLVSADAAELDGRSGQQSGAQVEEGQATPGWLRFTQVHADRNRLEQLDPATLVDRLANAVVRSLRGDPEDKSKRARMQLGMLPEELQDEVYERLENRLLSTEMERLLDLVDRTDEEELNDADGPEQNSLGVPFVEPDAAEEILDEREDDRRAEEKEQDREERPAEAPAPEGKELPADAPGSGTTDPGGSAPAPSPGQEQDRPSEGGREETDKPGGGTPSPNPGQEGGAQEPGGTPAGRGTDTEETAGQDGGRDSATGEKDGASGEKAEEKAGAESEAGAGEKGAESKDGEKAGGKEGMGKDGAEGEAGEQEEAPAASEEESAAKNRPGAAEALVESQKIPAEEKKTSEDKKAGSPMLNGKPDLDAEKRSKLEGQRSQDLEPEEKEPTPAQGGDSEVEVGGGEKSAWDTKLQPEDFLPEKDLDVSGVPTADKLDPSSKGAEPAMPSFAAPPPTKAEKVQAERDAEDAEEETDLEPEDESSGSALPDASLETEGSPEAGLGLNAVDKASGPKPGSGLPGAPPKTGEDEKAEPAAARAAEQEAHGKKDAEAASEQAAKEEKGAGGKDQQKDGAKGDKSQQAGGAKSEEGKASSSEEKKDAQGKPAEGKEGSKESEADAGKKDQAAPEETNGTTDDDKSPSAGRDSQTTGGSNADVPGQSSGSGNSSDSGSGGSSADTSSGGSSSGGSSSGGASETQASSSKPESAASGSPKSAPEPAKKSAAPVSNANSSAPPKAPDAPAPKAAKSGSKPAGKPAGKGTAPKRGGGGGGKGGGAKAKKESAAAPNLSQVAPEAGLSQASKLKPHRAMEAMGGITASVDRTVGDEHKQLAAAPPSMTRPAGSPQTLEGQPKTDAPAQYNQDAVQKSEAPKAEEAKIEGAKTPDENFDPGKGADEDDLDTVSTEDESLKQATTGTAPGVEMQGAAEETATAQSETADAKSQETLATGRQDAARAMGEDQIFPNAPKTEMKSKVPGPQGGGGGGGAKASVNTGAVPVEAVSEVAEHEKGPELQQAFSTGQKDMGASKEKKDTDFRESQNKHKQQVDKEVSNNTDQQSGERQKAMADVGGQREQWRTEQDAEVKKLGDKKTEKHEKARKEVKDKEEDTDKKAAKEKEDSDRKIAEENRKAKEDAEKKKEEEEKKKEDAPWYKKVWDFFVEIFNDLVDAIVSLVKKAFEAVTGFIKDFAEKVGGWINEARKWVENAVKTFVDAVVDFVKSAVQAVVDLAKKIGQAIVDAVKAAIDFVQKLADALMEIVGDLLDAIGDALSAALDFLGKALSAVVDAVVSGIKAVIDAATAILNALGDWMQIAADFLSDPGGWLSGAKSSAEDGAKNHLFAEVSTAVKQWFKTKIEEIIGVPKATLDKLISGGMSLDDIVKEAWEAVEPQLPLIIGELVMTKIVARLIPGAGWALAVIDAIRTAWGALSAILASIAAVLDWLKAVRQGGAGLLFAKAVAAGVVALLETLYTFLISGIEKYVSKVGSRLKGVAANMGKGKDKGGDKDKSGQGDDPKDKGKDDKGKDEKAEGKDDRPKDKDEKPGDEKKDGPAPVNLKKPGTTNAPGKGGPGKKNDKDKGPADKNDKGKHGTPGKGKDDPKNDTKPGGPGNKNKKDDEKDKDHPGSKPSTTKGKDGKDRDDDKKDTSPTPTPKPKPPAKPKPDHDTKPKPDKDSTKNDKADGKGDKDKKDDKSSDADPKKDRDADGKDTSKDKDGKDSKDKKKDKADGKRKKDKHQDSSKDRGRHKDRGSNRRKHHNKRSGDDRRNQKDERKKDEQENKEESLAEKLRRVHRKLKPKLDIGVPEERFPGTLQGLQRHYRLSRLWEQGGDDFRLWGKASPGQPGPTTGVHTPQGVVRTNPLEYPDPSPLTPPFSNGAYIEPKPFHQRFINQRWADTHGKVPPSGRPWKIENLAGFRHIGMFDQWKAPGRPAQWDLMHLLPRELGGPALSTNFTPAPNAVNRPFYSSWESKAAAEFGHKKGEQFDTKNPGDYDVDVSMFKGAAQGYPGNVFPKWFPESMSTRYRTYTHKGQGTGKDPSEWKPNPWKGPRSTLPFPRPPMPGNTAAVDLNKANLSTGTTKNQAHSVLAGRIDILSLVKRTRPFTGIADMKSKLFTPPSGVSPVADIAKEWPEIEQNYHRGHFTL